MSAPSRAALAACCLILSAPVCALDAVGTTAGHFEVTPAGAASYTIPLALPPGTAGLQPELAITYSSQSGNGALGLGFALAGLPAISRCPATLEQDGFVDGVDFDANDRFCLDGQRLVDIGSGELRTELESFTRVIAYGAATSPSYFRAWTKAGRILEFGGTGDARINAAGRNETLTWAVSKVSDHAGNYYVVAYDPEPGEFLPTSIRYTGHAGMAPYNEIRFVHERRPDLSSGYVGGGTTRLTRRLVGIELYAEGQRAREVRLDYAPVTGGLDRSRLVSITECAAGECLPPATFAWGGLKDGFLPPVGTPITVAGNEAVRDIVADFNADGRADVLTWHAPYNNSRYNLQLSSGTGAFTAKATVVQAYDNAAVPHLAGDFDADGLPDLLSWHVPSPTLYSLWRNNGTGFAAAATTGLRAHGNAGLSDIAADFTGDGRDDVLTWHEPFRNYRYNLHVSNGNGTFQAARATVVAGYENQNVNNFAVGDFTGDGLLDMLIWHMPFANHRYNLYAGNGTGFEPAVATNIALYDNPRLRNMVGDFNGDGLGDVLVWHAPYANYRFNLHLATGNPAQPFAPAIATALQGYDGIDVNNVHIADVNGDGLPDVVLYHVPLGNSRYNVHINTGDHGPGSRGFLPPRATSITTAATGGAPDFLADFSGDGRADFLVWNAGTRRYDLHPAIGSTPMVISEITNGLGADIVVRHAPLTDAAVYTKGPLPAYPQRALQVPMHVVADHRTPDGNGGTRKVSYTYAQARVHLRGRGALGFAQVTAVDHGTGLQQVTDYRQDFPYTGQAHRVRTLTAAGQTLSELERTLAHVTLTAPAGGVTQFAYAARTVQRAWEIATGNYVVTSTVSEEQYEEPPAHATFFGNATRATTSVHPGRETAGAVPFTTAHTSRYHNDATLWLIGLRTHAIVTRTYPATPLQARISAYEYHPSTGLLTAETLEPHEPALRLHTAHTRDAFGNIEKTAVSGAGVLERATTIAFDSRGRFPLRITNPLGHVEQRTYDPATGGVLSTTDVNGLVTRRTYDGFGRLESETFAQQGITRETTVTRLWCSQTTLCGPLDHYAINTRQSDGAGHHSMFDVLDRPTRTMQKSPAGGRVEVLTEYDAAGRVARRSAPRFRQSPTTHWTRWTYDAAGRVLAEAAPADQHSGGGRVTRFSYAGLLTTQHDAFNRPTQRETDALGRTIRVRDPLGGQLTFEYGAFDDLVASTDAGGAITRSVYDGRGRKIAMVDPDMGEWQYRYNAIGELIEQTDARGLLTAMTYDALGRMTARLEAGALSSWTYDTVRKGALTEVQSPDYRRTMAYHPAGLVARETIQIAAATSGAVPGAAMQTFSYAYGHDTLGRVQTIAYPSGFVLQQHYGATGAIDMVFPAGNSAAPLWRALDWDAWGHVSQAQLGNQTETFRQYDEAVGRLDAVIAGGPSGSVQSLNYGWDRVGNLVSRTDQLQGGLRETFEYDSLDRLTAARLGGTLSLALTYTGNGNIASKSGVGAYQYLPDKPHAVAHTAAGNRVYRYDPNGNLLHDGERSYVWSSANLPLQISSAAGTSDFLYGSERQRTRQLQRSGTALTLVYYAGSLYEEHWRGAAVERRHFIPTPDGVVAIRTHAGSTVRDEYLHKDHLGSVEVITGAAGKVLQRLSYDAFGKRRDVSWKGAPATTAFLTARGFTGHEHLDNVALIHMNGRVYDPHLGRFISADPLVQHPASTQSHNRYSYVGNNPLRYTDPSGFMKIGEFWKKFWRPIAAVVVSVVTYGAASGWAFSTAFASGLATANSVGAIVAAANTAHLIGGVVGGMAAGAAAGGIMTGTFKGALRGAAAGAVGGAVFGYFGSEYSATRIAADGAASGLASEIQGGNFKDGFKIGLGASVLTWLNQRSREAMARQSCQTFDNCSGSSQGLFNDQIKLGGGRRNGYDIFGECSSTMGGCQGTPISPLDQGPSFAGIPYEAGGALDKIVESFAGPHDWFRNATGSYDALGYSIREGFGDAFLNYVLVLPAAPLATAALVNTTPGAINALLVKQDLR